MLAAERKTAAGLPPQFPGPPSPLFSRRCFARATAAAPGDSGAVAHGDSGSIPSPPSGLTCSDETIYLYKRPRGRPKGSIYAAEPLRLRGSPRALGCP